MKIVVSTVQQGCALEVVPKTRTQEVFEVVCQTLGIHEIWYFGLMYYGPDNEEIWVKLSKKKLKDLQDNCNNLHFKVKYYPEDVGKELIETSTIQFFFLQVESSIVKDEIFCPADYCVLLASYALQVKCGDYNSHEYDENTLAKHKLLPERLTRQRSMNISDWHRDIINTWSKLNGLDKETAMLEYLKLSQKLTMYGISYFRVRNKEKRDLFLGVTATGINMYNEEDRSRPTMSLLWSEIRKMTFVKNKFIVKPTDKKAKDIVVFTQDLRTSKCILNLAVGGHALYIRRRNPESLEVAEIRAHARRNKSFQK